MGHHAPRATASLPSFGLSITLAKMIFHICTISNKLLQYEEMKSSFIAAGFDEGRCRYSVFDNSEGNIYEPYSTFNAIRSNTAEPYIIFCHQDVLLNQGHGFDQLVKVVEELDKLDPNWAVVGNSGFNRNYQHTRRITDPHGGNQCYGSFPDKVNSLDENFLVIKSSANVMCSLELRGFHFYATDLCLNAILKGYSCYVIDFHLTHLSAGKVSQDFEELRTMFEKKWSREFNLYYLITPSSAVFLSRNRVIRYIFHHNKVARRVLSHPRIQAFERMTEKYRI